MKKELPLGYSAFEKIISNNAIYVDKTKFIAMLTRKDGNYFLSRPRRFGKSLLVDTLKQAFLGNKKLFAGLYLENNWSWDITYPVIHFDFSNTSAEESKLNLSKLIRSTLESHAEQYDVTLKYPEAYNVAFDHLIKDIATKCGKSVVILVDEYDKAILDVITDREQAIANRELLKGLYGAIKKNDANLKFVLLTGVTKFSQVNMFSGLNNLTDISLDARYADICGYTQEELENNFAEYLKDGRVNLDDLKLWYNGYNFLGNEQQRVYSPYDLLLFFDKNYQYNSYWFETGTPSFMIKLLEREHFFIPNLEYQKIGSHALRKLDVDDIQLPPLLFQSGYLTIKEELVYEYDREYVLSYPNLEVKIALNELLAEIGAGYMAKEKSISRLKEVLRNSLFDELGNMFTSHFASIPHHWYTKNNNSENEGFYASVVYSLLCASTYNVIPEDITNIGRMDLTVKMSDKIIILEFKLSSNADAIDAITQIKSKDYPAKYVADKLPIYLVGISFDPKARNLCDYKWELFMLVGKN